MLEQKYKRRHVCLTIWTWFFQIIAQTSLFFLLLDSFYEKKRNYLMNKYENYYNDKNVPYYFTNLYDINIPYNPILIIFFVSYTIYIITEFFSSTCKYLCHKKRDEKIYQKMFQLFTGRPTITLKMECYHYETERKVYYDRNGYQKTETQTKTVVTYTESFIVPYHSVIDVSGTFVLDSSKGILNNKDFVKLKLFLLIDWADEISKSDFKKYKDDLIDKNKYRDDYYNCYEEKTLSGFNSYNLILIGDNKPCTVSIFWYILFTLLTLVQYYKWYVDSKCIHQEFTIHKLVSTRNNLLENPEYLEKKPKLDLIGNVYEFNSNKISSKEKELKIQSIEINKEVEEKNGEIIKINNDLKESLYDVNKEDDELN